MSDPRPYVSLGEKLQGLFLRSVGVFFLFVAIGFVLDKVLIYKTIAETTLDTQAKVIGENCSAAIIFRDEKNSAEILGSLRSIPEIIQGTISLKNGEMLAQYLKEGGTPASFPETVFPAGPTWTFSHLSLVKPITQSGEVIGTVFLRYDFSNFFRLILFEMTVTCLFLFVAILIAYMVFSKVQKSISEPIMLLVDTMERVTNSQDYSQRVALDGEGEVAILAKGFNGMLAQIQTWNRQLADHQEALERKVVERTLQLRSLNTRLEQELVQGLQIQAELRKKTEQLEITSEERKRALEAEKRFLASVSHEIRNPLNVILGATEILMKAPLDGFHSKLLSSVHSSSIFLLALITDILDVSKIDAGQMELQIEAFSLREVLMDCLDLVSGRVQKGVALQHDLDLEPGFVQGDPTRIKQIFLNLLMNSAKFTKSGSIKLRLAETTSPGEGKVSFKFCIEDTGIGITKEKLQVLGQPFRQAHSSHFGGSGLGVFLTTNIAKMMDGGLEIQSQEGVGTKVFVWFTLERSNETISGKLPSLPASSPKDFSKLRILLVEDEEMNIIVGRGILSTFFGISEVQSAVNGAEAMDKAKQGSRDIIFMDIQMPVMDGITATREIRKAGVTTPIIALSAHAFLSEIEKAKEAGMNDYISKPLKAERLLEVFRKFCDAGKTPS